MQPLIKGEQEQLRSHQINQTSKKIIREGHFVMLKGLIHQEDIKKS